jgi:ABC-2 type transport system permease protein
MSTGLASNLRVLRAIFVKDLKQAVRYPAQIVVMFAIPFLFALLVRAMGTYAGGAKSLERFFQETGTTNIFVYQVLGGAIWLLSWVIIDRIGSSLREERVSGTLEQVYLAPINRFLLLVSKALVNFVTSGLTFLIVVALSIFLFDRGAAAALPQAFLVLCLGLIPLWGISFLFAGLIVRFKEPYAFINVTNLAFSILIGTYYPITILPQWAQVASRFLPQTYALDAMRHILLSNTSLFSLSETYAVLLGMAVVYPLLGFVVFKLFLDRATVNGDLSKF